MQYYTGLKLYSLARNKASKLGVTDTAMKMDKLIHVVQQREGNNPCFRKQQSCDQSLCCWKAACGAEIYGES